ncbi:MAG: hypothetical protein KA484_06870 [Rhodocyclaceae bacterium]|nr:hypothetical protein [Rhodocyclaceae bacterium]
MVDNGTSLLDHLGYVGTAAVHGLYDGGVQIYKFAASLAAEKFEEAKIHGTEALAFLLGMKTGETLPLWNKTKLKLKQMAFDLQQAAVGIINRSPLEFVKKGSEGQALLIKKESVPNISDPTAPPKEVTTVLKPAQVAQEARGNLLLNADGTVTYAKGFCFGAGTLVHTKKGLVPIEQIKVGDWVLSKHENGQGEQAYKRVTRTITSEDVSVGFLKYFTENKLESLVVTGNHPFYIKDFGWFPAGNVSYPSKLDAHDGAEVGAWEWNALWETGTPGLAITFSDQNDCATFIDFSSGTAVIVDELGNEGVSNGADWCQTVYNIEVEDFHTYYVGELGVWVHNTNCGGAGDAGIKQNVTLQNLIPTVQVYDRVANSGLPSPANLKAPGVILEIERSNLTEAALNRTGDRPRFIRS